MLYKKIYMRPPGLIALWLVMFFGPVMLIMIALSFPIEILEFKRSPGIDLWALTIASILIFVPCWVLWRKATFAKKDFVKLVEGWGVRLIKKRTPLSPRFYGIYRFAYGELNDIRVAAIIASPFFSYFPGDASIGFDLPKRQEVPDSAEELHDKRTRWEKTQAYLFAGKKGGPEGQESEIEFISLIKGPYDIDVAVKLQDGKGDIPATGCPEIDSNLKKHLAGVTYFNARLIFNKDCLRMAIIGGSWEGKRFGDKIQKGFEIFQDVHNALKVKYTIESWDKYQIKWDRAEHSFYLANS